MTDIQGAIGIEQMKRLPGIVARRRELAARYSKALERHPWLLAPFIPEWAEPNFQTTPCNCRRTAPLSRDDLMQWFLERGIAMRRGIMLAHVEPACADLPRCPLPRSEQASASLAALASLSANDRPAARRSHRDA